MLKYLILTAQRQSAGFIVNYDLTESKLHWSWPFSLVHTPNINTDTAINIDKLMLKIEIHILPVTINAQCTQKWIITFEQWLIKGSAVLDLTFDKIDKLCIMYFTLLFLDLFSTRGWITNQAKQPITLRVPECSVVVCGAIINLFGNMQ